MKTTLFVVGNPPLIPLYTAKGVAHFQSQQRIFSSIYNTRDIFIKPHSFVNRELTKTPRLNFIRCLYFREWICIVVKNKFNENVVKSCVMFSKNFCLMTEEFLNQYSAGPRRDNKIRYFFC